MFAHVFLALVAVGQVTDTPVWQADYSAARNQAVAQKKPLAVVLGAGANGLDKVVSGGLDKETSKRLAVDFVCLYIDTNSPAGKSLAIAFEITGGHGVVFSDRSANSQAFWKQGTITGQEFAKQVQLVSSSSRVSFYPSDSAASILTGGTTGATFQSSSSFCPNCQNGGSTRYRR